ncbi:SusD-like starch-binding protein associating with outer membrane [Mucilaginibacter yixingensis]|uniref:SusD-like starch-binding protein associating with outer membrane n=1 Tax=Mucilaginibacter yixingensis TaxID=1295612 RepID=A0A2T5JGH2_9SPHI|nr:RagB/SusD family nutrient uptake outer membrane protein [Mucilaginibacter yixingensis]PTR01509.1 SusD-like starch-binding protein associating with outer membrane [Mucilaginibacter yixingensis]
MKKISITLLIAAFLFNSCTKVLDQVPQDKITEQNFYKSSGDAEAAAVGIYDAAQALSTQAPVAFDAASDLATAQLINFSPFSQHGITVDNATVALYWQNNYVGIGRCNDVLKNVPGIDANLFIAGQKERILGEAYFMRAYFYFNLLKAFGGVPLVTVPYSSFNDDFTIARSSSDQTYDQIIADLKLAETNLPVSYPNNVDTRGRATQGGAKALMAKVYLARKDYTNAAAKALEVMNNTTYTLVSGQTGYTNMFNPASKNSTESIFEIQYVSSSSEGNGTYSYYVPTPAPAGTQGSSYQIVPTSKIINAFETGDIRKAVSITMSPATIPVPFVGKYIRLTSGLDANIIVMRLADIILVRAEALNELGQTADATAALNIIRRRAFGLPLTTTSVRDFPSANDVANNYDLRLAIENERMKELCFEGHRFHDLVRTGRAAAVLGITTNQTLWPIPLRETGRNPKLQQNPGY